MRFSNIILAYFVIGATMWAGGVIAWGDAGMAKLLVTNPQEGEFNEETTKSLQETKGPIEEAISAVGGGALLAVLDIVLAIVNFLFWPMAVLIQHNTPARVWVPLGGAPTMAFYGGVIRLIRTSG